MKSSGKKNENASVLEILNALNINGAHITVDAMNTQKTIATKITKGGADYTMCVKDNHKNLKQQIAAYFHKVQRDTPDLIKTITTVDSGHGRIEQEHENNFKQISGLKVFKTGLKSEL